jgi:hypothetical protein
MCSVDELDRILLAPFPQRFLPAFAPLFAHVCLMRAGGVRADVFDGQQKVGKTNRQRRMGDRAVGNAEPIEQGKQIGGRRGHCRLVGRDYLMDGGFLGARLASDKARSGQCGRHWAPRLQSVPAFGIGDGARPLPSFYGCGCSSGVEHNLAKVGVVGSNPIARSSSICDA